MNYSEFAGYEYGAMGYDAMQSGRNENAENTSASRLAALALVRYGSIWVWPINASVVGKRRQKLTKTPASSIPTIARCGNRLFSHSGKRDSPAPPDEKSPARPEKGDEDGKAAEDDPDEAPTHKGRRTP